MQYHPFGRACALPLHRYAESAIQGVSLAIMIPNPPAQNKWKIRFWGIAACPATAQRDASSQHTEDANPIPPISWLVSLEEKPAGHSVPHSQPRVLSFLAVVRLPSYTYCHPDLHSLPAAEDHGQMTTTTFDHPRLECNRIIWHINKHNVAHYLYFYGTIYIFMWHINISGWLIDGPKRI